MEVDRKTAVDRTHNMRDKRTVVRTASGWSL
jgi:hypothetical protein